MRTTTRRHLARAVLWTSVALLLLREGARCGMLAMWTFDEASASSVGDHTGNGNTPYLGNMDDASFVAGRWGRSLSFDGLGQWVDFATCAAIHAITGTLTVEIWVRADPEQHFELVLLFDKSHGCIDTTGWLFQPPTHLHPDLPPAVGMGFGTPQGWVCDGYATDIYDGQWHFWVGSYDGSAIRTYYDGVYVSATAYTGIHNPNTRNMEMGRLWGAGFPSRYFHGCIDDAAVWDVALDANTIRDHYLRGIPIPGDTDGDRDVDFLDYLAVKAGFGKPGGWAEGDFDGDGDVDFVNYLVAKANFGLGCPAGESAAGSSAIPEPASLSLLVLASIRAASCRGRRRGMPASIS